MTFSERCSRKYTKYKYTFIKIQILLIYICINRLYTNEDVEEDEDQSNVQGYHDASKHTDCDGMFGEGCPFSILALLLSYDPRANLIS